MLASTVPRTVAVPQRAGRWPDERRRGRAPVARTRVEVAGARPRLLQAGPEDSPEAVVFVHGNPGSADDWEALIGAAAGAGKRALALDLPDFGETEAPPGFEHTVPGYAGFLAAALRRLGVERAHLAIHDFGGPIGLFWAAAHPDAVASVTLIDTGILPGYRWHTMARIWRTPVLGELFQATATRPAFRYLVNRGEPRGLPRPFLEQMYDHYDRRTRRAVLKLYRATDELGAAGESFTAALAPARHPGAGDLGRSRRLPAGRLRRPPARGLPLRRRPRAARPAATGRSPTRRRRSSGCWSISSRNSGTELRTETGLNGLYAQPRTFREGRKKPL